MPTKVLSNQNVTVWVGPDTAIADYNAPKTSEVNSLTNYSEAIKWSGFDFAPSASKQESDTSLTDAAGAQTRSYAQWGGHLSFWNPLPGAVAGDVFYDARQAFRVQRQFMAVVVRINKSNTLPAVDGDEVYAFRVMNDAIAQSRGTASLYYTVSLLSQGSEGVNAILAPATPAALTVSVDAGTDSIAVGGVVRLRAVTQGKNVTVGTTWSVDDPTLATVTPHGVVIGLAAGSVNVTASYPGAAASTPTAITVTSGS